jgi:hypothetical protein
LSGRREEPGDEHGHDGGFPGAGGEFQSQPEQLRIGFVVGVLEVFEKRAAGLPSFGATSESQMATSTASIWQKKGRMVLKGWVRQCLSSRSVSGVTSQSLGSRHARQRST